MAFLSVLFVCIMQVICINAQKNYMFDSSCGVHNSIVNKFVRNGFQNALIMAQAASDAVLQHPVGEYQNTLAFLISNGRPLNGWDDAQMIFNTETGVNRLLAVNGGREVFENAALSHDLDVKVYCDMTRIRKFRNTDGGLYYIDTDIYQEVSDGDANSCTFLSRDLAWTTETWKIDTDSKNRVDGFKQITICPLFLNYALPTRNPWTAAISADWYKKQSVALVKSVFSRFFRTPIDAYSLFDKVLVHEMTHALQSQAKTIDVNNDGEKAYGWRKCRELSTTDTIHGAGPIGPEKNADTWALFASVCYQLRTQRLVSINADGTMNVAINAVKRLKRTVGRRVKLHIAQLDHFTSPYSSSDVSLKT